MPARDAAHYRDLLSRNAGASVGYTLAASAVYAARHGECEAEHHGTEEWGGIARDLRRRYGEDLTVSQVLAEMERPHEPRTRTIRLRVSEAEYAAITDAAGGLGLGLSEYIRSVAIPGDDTKPRKRREEGKG